MSPQSERLIYTLIAIGCGVAAAFIPAASPFLAGTAGVLLGKAHFSKPGESPTGPLP